MYSQAFYLPEPIYKILPWVYIGCGALVIATLHNFIGTMSGVMLVASGILVMLWRTTARSQRRRKAKIRHQQQMRHRPQFRR